MREHLTSGLAGYLQLISLRKCKCRLCRESSSRNSSIASHTSRSCTGVEWQVRLSPAVSDCLDDVLCLGIWDLGFLRYAVLQLGLL